jgi:hypothetical protein
MLTTTYQRIQDHIRDIQVYPAELDVVPHTHGLYPRKVININLKVLQILCAYPDENARLAVLKDTVDKTYILYDNKRYMITNHSLRAAYYYLDLADCRIIASYLAER